jgi:hypothetical protein
MKFSTKLLILAIICLLNVFSETRRIKTHHKTHNRGIGANLLQLFSGFISGLSGADGADINSCLPQSWRSDNLRQDTSDTLPAQFDSNSLGALKYVYEVVKWALEVACIFKDQLLKYFKVVRRRNRMRLFIQKFASKWGWGIGDWISEAWKDTKNYVASKWESLKNWVTTQWSDVKKWTSEQLEKVKNWAKEKWENFKNGINNAVEKIKSLYNQIKTFVTSDTFINGIKLLIKCGVIAFNLVMNIINVVKAIIAIVSGNVVQWAVMIVNFICNLGEVYKAIQIAIAIFGKDKPWYYTGKFVGHLLNLFGSTVSGKDTDDNATKAPSKFQQLLKWIKDNNVVEIGSAAYATYKSYDSATSRPIRNESGLVQDGDTIVIIHKLTGKSLHSHSINYSGGSKQQEVTGYDKRDDNDLWTIHHFNRGLVGTGFRDSDVVTIVHKATKKTLHSHAITSPVTSQQEVSGFGSRDTNDNWRLEISDGDGYLRVGGHFKLIHINTDKSLHSHPNMLTGGSRQQEVTGFTSRDDNDYWRILSTKKRLRRH